MLRGCVSALALVLAGTTAALAQSNTPIKVGLILTSYDQIRWQNGDQPCFEAEAKKLGMEYSTVASQMSETVQASQVENMLTQGIDVLVLRPVNAGAALGLVRKASQAGVPVINYNFLIDKADVVCFLGRDATEMGEKIAKAAVEAHPKGNYVIAAGEESTSVARDAPRLSERLAAFSRQRRHQARVGPVQQELVDRYRPRPGRERADQEQQRPRGRLVRQ